MTHVFSSTLDVSVTCADIPGLLRSAQRGGLVLTDIKPVAPITIHLGVSRADYPLLRQIVKDLGGNIHALHNRGLRDHCRRILKRPLIVITAGLLSLLTVFLPTRVFFISVEGNSQLPANYILQEAVSAGVSFGVSREALRNEKVKNVLLQRIPQLQWAGINTQGCTATIHVKERSAAEKEKAKSGIASIIASRDGILLSCNILKGRGICTVGQAVKEGDVLVSGYTDTGTILQGCAAEAEVKALTERAVTLKMPLDYRKRGEVTGTQTCYGLRIGKKQIKFCNHSGIYDTTCVKMYSEEFWVLPGGFSLPVAWTKESVFYYGLPAIQQTGTVDHSWLASAAKGYTVSQMVAGQILSEQTEIHSTDSLITLTGNYTCQEMIGQVRYEEILE